MSAADDNDDQQYSGRCEKASNTNECTSCEQNNVDNITEGINSVVLVNVMFACASCGKEGNSNDMNTCNKCESMKYCNAACKKKHRKKHKKACERRVAELHDEKLFKEHPPTEECPICMLPLQYKVNKTCVISYKSCCGKMICHGCIYAMKMSEGGLDLCAFCRTPTASPDEELERTTKLVDKGNGDAFNYLAGIYSQVLYYWIIWFATRLSKGKGVISKGGRTWMCQWIL